VWFHDRSSNWHLSMDIGNQDLALLIGYKLKSNWGAALRFICLVEDPQDISEAENYLQQLAELARIPNVEVWVRQGAPDDLDDVPGADLNIIPMSGEKPDFELFRRWVGQLDSALIFTLDSGQESALA